MNTTDNIARFKAWLDREEAAIFNEFGLHSQMAQENKSMATTASTASVVLSILFAGQSNPTNIVLDPNAINLPVAGKITFTASSPTGALTEDIVATGEIDGFTLPSIPLASFPIDLTGTLGILAEIVKAANARIQLVITAQ